MDSMLNDCQLHEQLGLNEKSCDLKEFRRVYEASLQEPTYSLQPITLLSTFFADNNDVQKFHRQSRLGRVEKHLAKFLLKHREEAFKNKDNMEFFKHIIVEKNRGKINERKVSRNPWKFPHNT
jgi:hypothetical protein